MAIETPKDCEFRVLGLMSGTSLDGLDIALCRYSRTDGFWKFSVDGTKFVAYTKEWQRKLTEAYSTRIEHLSPLDYEYGVWIGQQVVQFLNGRSDVDLIASHGHTTHHDPANGITNQLGCGKAIANSVGIPTVHDFRSKDVALGGQGAPLVPIGDKLLFGDHDAYINLGGFSNISFESNGARKAFDICPLNIILNAVANELGKPYDSGGIIASTAEVNPELLADLNSTMSRFRHSRPSLSREWVDMNLKPIIDQAINPQDRLRTFVEYAAFEIAHVLNEHQLTNTLITGGGAYNTYLIERLKAKTTCCIILPKPTIIDFKEAIVFGFLGVLRMLNEVNVLKSVTGANEDSSSGRITYPS